MKYIALSLLGLVLSTGRHFAAPQEVDASLEWIYSKHLNLYVQMFADPEIEGRKKQELRESAQHFFFSYWIFARSGRASGKPAPKFEQAFVKYVQKQLDGHVDPKDPLGIKDAFSNGQLRKNVMIQNVEGITYQDIDTEAKYGSLVSDFLAFVEKLKSEKPWKGHIDK